MRVTCRAKIIDSEGSLEMSGRIYLIDKATDEKKGRQIGGPKG